MAAKTQEAHRDMTTVTKRFEPGVALTMVQAFHRELEVNALLERIFNQAVTLSPATHLGYTNTDSGIDFSVGEPGQHSVNYNLQLGTAGINGGEVKLTAPRRFSTGDLETLEELLHLVAPALANALIVHGLTTKDRSRKVKKAKPNQEDALILVRLSGIDMVRASHGTAVAQQLTDKLQQQLAEKLREADGVFQIDDDHLAVLLPRTTKAGAQRVASKVETLVNSLDFAEAHVREHVSATIGISTTNGANSAEAVLSEARSALSEAAEHQTRNILVH
ncbi:MAG: diguanylate cyclase [Gammaproteobacteria bacterium]|nr:diguanylate cyclase [Gammaproteobacteria bacterium]